MRKAFIYIGLLFISISVKSQKWNPEFVKSLKEYYFIPVEFENFGEWITGIEKDSSILFHIKVFSQVDDSIYLNLVLKKPDLPSPFNHSTLTNRLLGNTVIDKKGELETAGIYIVKNPDVKPRKVTVLSIFASISFDTSTTGRLLARQTQIKLEERFGVFFTEKRVDKANKNIRKRLNHPEVERRASFKRRDDLNSMFHIRTYNLKEVNKVELCLSYELDH